MSLMGSLYIGQSGLQTSQNSLHTVAHNLSNIETKGYTRQQTLLGDREYNNIGIASISKQQTGLGVDYSKVRQVRDVFLDQSYRREAGRSSFYEICYESTSEIETMLGELDGASFKESLNDLWTAVEELQKDPSSSVTQGTLVSACQQFLERSQAVYNGLIDYQDNLNSRIKDIIDEINDIGNQIYELNIKIKMAETGIEEANDLRDTRNYLLDRLGEITKISYSEDSLGAVEVSIEGTPFVLRDHVFEMGYTVSEGNEFITPVWPQNENQQVFDYTQAITSEISSDVGELKAILLARGDHRADYSDLEKTNAAGELTYNLSQYDPATKGYSIAVSSSIVMNTQAEFDRLVHGVVTEINNILTGEKSQIDAGSDPAYSYGSDLPMEMFVRLGTSRYTDTGSGYEYVAEDETGSPSNVSTMYTTSNIKINPDFLKQPTLLSFVKEDNSVDYEKADALAAAFATDFATLNPNLTAKYEFRDYYSALVGQLANTGSVYSSIVDGQSATVSELEDARQSIMGVSSNEELSNMIKFQNAYNASSRFINAINEMLGHVIERLG